MLKIVTVGPEANGAVLRARMALREQLTHSYASGSPGPASSATTPMSGGPARNPR